MLVRTERSGVNRDIPVDLPGGISASLDPLQQVLPGAVGRPGPMSLVHGLPRPVLLWKVTPVHASLDSMQYPVDHLTVITPPAAPAVAHRQQQSQPLPLGITQITRPMA